MKIAKKLVHSSILTEDLYFITMTNNDISLVLTNYGAMISNIYILHKDIDIVLGCNTIDEYVLQSNYYGATVGRYANRIGKGHFKIGNEDYDISINEPPNHIHGGFNGFDKKVWSCDIANNSVLFTYFSKDSEEGYPGNLNITVKYTLTDKNEILIEYYAKSDKNTILNITNHSYFNLNGENSKDVKNHLLKINSKFITEVDENNIPNGNLINITNSNFDFNEEKSIEHALSKSNVLLAEDYDHNYVLDDTSNLKASIYSPITNIKMKLFTSYPCMQLYTCSNIDGTKGKTRNYGNYSAICLEPQFAPNSINIPSFKQPVLLKDKDYYEYIKYKFVF